MISCPDDHCRFKTQRPKHMAQHIERYGHNPHRRRKEFRGDKKFSGGGKKKGK